MHVPKEIHDVAEFLVDEGYRYSEAFPVDKWKRMGWRTDQPFLEAVDACMKLIRALQKMES
jgi:hypothetical protein